MLELGINKVSDDASDFDQLSDLLILQDDTHGFDGLLLDDIFLRICADLAQNSGKDVLSLWVGIPLGF